MDFDVTEIDINDVKGPLNVQIGGSHYKEMTINRLNLLMQIILGLAKGVLSSAWLDGIKIAAKVWKI